jgi:Xaa-Pro aminopeptidase
VLEVQEFAFAQLKPGVSIREYEKTIEHFMGEKLRELGLIKSIDRETVRHYYPHATSHSLGLDVHDLADYERPLEPNMVVTVEPGIYIPEEGLGVRMEDDVLITADGHRNMTEKLPREL